MKFTKTYLANLFILLSITTISAQYGNSSYGGNGYGNNGSISQSGALKQNSMPDKPKEIAPEETVAKFMEVLKPTLELDELQSIAITNVLLESMDSQGRIAKLNLSSDEEYAEFQSLSEKTDRDINNYLSPEQKEKYLAYKEENKNPKEKKKKKKKKK